MVSNFLFYTERGDWLSTCRPRKIGVNIGEKVEKSRDIKRSSKLFRIILCYSLRNLTAKNGKFYRKFYIGFPKIKGWKPRGQMLPGHYQNLYDYIHQVLR